MLVLPIHFPIAVPVVIHELAHVLVPRRPRKDPLSMLLVVLKCAFIFEHAFLSLVPFGPHTLSVPYSIPKAPYVNQFAYLYIRPRWPKYKFLGLQAFHSNTDRYTHLHLRNSRLRAHA